MDENGEPLVVAHSTDASFTVFRDMQKNDAGWLGAGFYFFGDRSLDGQYGDKVMECFLNVRNPYYLSPSEHVELAGADSAAHSREFSENLRDDGYDGVYFNGDGNKEYAVFSPSQIKSATDNTGAFDAANPDIRFSVPPGAQWLPGLSPDEERNLAAARTTAQMVLDEIGGTELGNAVNRDFRETGRANLVGRKISSMRDLAALAQIYRNPCFETLRYFFVKDGRVAWQTGVTCRLPGSATTFDTPLTFAAVGKFYRTGRGAELPGIAGEIYRAVNAIRPDAVYLLHNHPSGNITASKADILTTFNMMRLFEGMGVEFAGHLIIDHDKFTAIDAMGETRRMQADFSSAETAFRGESGENPSVPSELLKAVRRPGPPAGPGDIARYAMENARALDRKGGAITLVGLDIKFVNVKSVSNVPAARLADYGGESRTVVDLLNDYRAAAGAGMLMAVADAEPRGKLRSQVRQAIRSGALMDYIWHDGRGNWTSAQAKGWGAPDSQAEAEQAAHRAARVDDGQKSYSVSIVKPWAENFPHATLMTTRTALMAKYADLFAKAKAGDGNAAMELVDALMADKSRRAKILQLKKDHPRAAIAAPVHAEEASGRNKIPAMFAKYIADALGMEVDNAIVQSGRAGHTGADAWHRLTHRAQFEGEVAAGKEYILVDDHVTQGGTINELRSYIENNGGKVVAVAALTASKGSAILAPSKETIDELKARYPDVDDLLRAANIAGSVEAVTNSEAEYILKFSPAEFRRRVEDTIRDISADEQGGTRGDSIRTQTVPPDAGRDRGFAPRFERDFGSGEGPLGASAAQGAQGINRSYSTATSAPQGESPYFAEAPGAMDFPIVALRTVKDEPERSIANAQSLIERAAAGSIPKRAPVSVVENGDGTYTVIDGNATTWAAARGGLESVRAKIVGKDRGTRLRNSGYLVKQRKDGADADGELRTHGLDGLSGEAARERMYEQAEANKGALRAVVDAAAKAVGGEALHRKTLKKRARVDEKAKEYGGEDNPDYSRVVDLIGGTVVMPDSGDFTDAVKAIEKNLPQGASIAKVKPFHFGPNDTGYQDVKVSVRFVNGGIGEIIIIEKYLNDAKFNSGGHTVYDSVRVLDGLIDRADKGEIELPPEIRRQIDDTSKTLEKLSAMIYARGPEAVAFIADFERMKALATSQVQDLLPLITESISAKENDAVKSLSSEFHLAKPPSVDSYAMPKRSFIQNDISDSSLENNESIPETGGLGNTVFSLGSPDPLAAALMRDRAREAADRRSYSVPPRSTPQPAPQEPPRFPLPNLWRATDDEYIAAALAARMALGKDDDSARSIKLTTLYKYVGRLHPQMDIGDVMQHSQRVMLAAHSMARNFREHFDKGVSEGRLARALKEPELLEMFTREMRQAAREGARLGAFGARAEAGISRRESQIAAALDRRAAEAAQTVTGMETSQFEQTWGLSLVRSLANAVAGMRPETAPGGGAKAQPAGNAAAGDAQKAAGEAPAAQSAPAAPVKASVPAEVAQAVEAALEATRPPAPAADAQSGAAAQQPADGQNAAAEPGGDAAQESGEEPEGGAGADPLAPETMAEIQKNVARLENPRHFAQFVAELLRRWWVREHNLLPHDPAWHSQVAFMFLKKSAVAIFRSLAREIAFTGARETAVRIIERMPSCVNSAQLVDEMERVADIIRMRRREETKQAALENPGMLARLLRASMITNKIGDIIPSLVIGQGIYRDFLAQGLSPQAAMSRTWEIIERTQQSSRMENCSQLQRRSKLGRLFLQFLTTQQQYLQYEVRAFREVAARAGQKPRVSGRIPRRQDTRGRKAGCGTRGQDGARYAHPGRRRGARRA